MKRKKKKSLELKPYSHLPYTNNPIDFNGTTLINKARKRTGWTVSELWRNKFRSLCMMSRERFHLELNWIRLLQVLHWICTQHGAREKKLESFFPTKYKSKTPLKQKWSFHIRWKAFVKQRAEEVCYSNETLYYKNTARQALLEASRQMEKLLCCSLKM